MSRIELNTLTRTITADALAHPHDLAAALAERHGVSRPVIGKLLRRLADTGWLVRREGARSPHAPGLLREVTHDYEIAGLDEHRPWRSDVLPLLALSPAVTRLAQHAFGELLNNAIDHSEGSRVTVSVRQTPTHLHLLFADDGAGLFRQLAAKAGLADTQQAALELAKGRLTTEPDAHGGRGLFFVARMVDALNLQAGDQVLQWREQGARVSLRQHPNPLPRPGTTVFASIALSSTQRVADAYAAFGSADEPLDFSRTRVPLRLMADHGMALDSRAQARWVCSRLELFATAELDFDGIEEVGPSFIDEVYRVYRQAHPEVRLETTRVAPALAPLLGKHLH